jgi:hypothetical protein
MKRPHVRRLDQVDDDLLELVGGLLRIHPLAQQRGRQAVGERDRLPDQHQAHIGRDHPERQARRDVLHRVRGLQALPAHQGQPADHDQQHEARVGHHQRTGPQLPDPILLIQLRCGQQRPPRNPEHRLDRRGHQILEPAVDRLLGPARDIEHSALI